MKLKLVLVNIDTCTNILQILKLISILSQDNMEMYFQYAHDGFKQEL